MSEHYLEPEARPILYAVTGDLGGNAVAEHGQTQIGDATGVGQTLAVVSGEDENEFVGAVSVDVWPELPDSGWLEAGDIYQWNNIAVMVRQSHNRTEHDPPDVPALFIVYRADDGALDWIAGEQVQVGTRRIYDGTEYACLQAHVSQADWTPPATLGTLWSLVAPPTADWAAGVAYTGDNTAGAGNGDHVLYLGNKYRCLQSHTSIQTWNPVAAASLWALVT